MAQTLISAVATLCPVADFLKRIDRLAVAKLASDDVNGVPIADGSLPNDPNVLAALMDASGVLESAVMMGGKYSAEDLQVLRTTTCAAQGMMFRIVSDLAWVFLFERRPNKNVLPPPSMQRTIEWLEMLRQGTRIFAFREAQSATIMEKVDANDRDVWQRNGVITQASAYFGVRSWERGWPYYG